MLYTWCTIKREVLAARVGCLLAYNRGKIGAANVCKVRQAQSVKSMKLKVLMRETACTATCLWQSVSH